MRTTPSKSIVSTILFVGTVAVLALPSVANAQAGPYQYYAVSPCRVYDTRTGQPSAGGNGGGTIASATVRAFRIRGYCGVPSGAAAISGNFTIVNPTAAAGDLRIAPYPGSFPNVSTSNFLRGDTLANGAIVPLGAVGNPGVDLDFQVLGAGCDTIGGVYTSNNSFTFDLLIDVTGYFQ